MVGTLYVCAEMRNTGGPAGWKGYILQCDTVVYMTTAPLWKCTNVTQTGDRWTLASYNDSLWVNPGIANRQLKLPLPCTRHVAVDRLNLR